MDGSGLLSLPVDSESFQTIDKYNMTGRMSMPQIDSENEYAIIQVNGTADLTSLNAENTQYQFTLDSMTDYYDFKNSFFKIRFFVSKTDAPTYYTPIGAAGDAQEITNGLCPFDRVTMRINGSTSQDIQHLPATELCIKHIFQSPSMDQSNRAFGWDMDIANGAALDTTYRARLCQSTGADKSLNTILYQPPLAIFSSEPGVSVGARYDITFYRSSNAIMLYGNTGDGAVATSKVVLERIEWYIPKPKPVAEQDALVKKSLAEGLAMRHYFIHPRTFEKDYASTTSSINEYITTLKKLPRAVIVYFKLKDATLYTASANSDRTNYGVNYQLPITEAYIDLGSDRYPQIPYQIDQTSKYSYHDYSREYGALLKLNGSLSEARGSGCLIDWVQFEQNYLYLVFNISEYPVTTLQDEGFPLRVNINCNAPGGADAFRMYTTILTDGEISIEPRSGTVRAIGYQ